ncbi:MAG: 5,6-dimethylbenzimidazole synthase, partial [Mycobacteriaceae bacterium]
MTVFDAIRLRRDVRAEFSGSVISEEVLQFLLQAAHCAPSVGNSQPWDFIVIRDRQRLQKFATHVAAERQKFADSLPADRRKTFNPIKIDGICESGTGIVVTYNASRGGAHILGRQSIADTGLFSAVLAIENLWLAATSEGIGVGWVSFYQEQFLSDFISAPAKIRPIAW